MGAGSADGAVAVMGDSLTTKAIRALITAGGNDGRRYVPGSLDIRGQHMDWTEKCRARCPHDTDICHMSRSGLVPSLNDDAA